MPTPSTFPVLTGRLAVLLLAGTLAWAGCDAIEQLAGLDRVDVSLGSAGTVSVVPNAVSRSGSNVNVGQSLPGSPSVNSIQVRSDAVRFEATPARGAEAASQASGTLSYWILIDHVPAVSGTVQINDANAVTNVTANYAASYTVAQICAAYAEGSCPVTSVRPSDEIRSHVTQALRSGSFSVDVIVQNPSALSGTLVIESLRFDISL